MLRWPSYALRLWICVQFLVNVFVLLLFLCLTVFWDVLLLVNGELVTFLSVFVCITTCPLSRLYVYVSFITVLPPPPCRHCEHCSSRWESHYDLCVQFLPCLLWSAEGTLWPLDLWPCNPMLLTNALLPVQHGFTLCTALAKSWASLRKLVFIGTHTATHTQTTPL